jgi:hypothetical protein
VDDGANIRIVFLESAAAARRLLADPAAGRRWDDASVLEQMTIGDLCGHLMRSATNVVRYMSEPQGPDVGPLLDAPGYLLSIDGLSSPEGPDLDSELHSDIRHRAAVDAADGSEAVRRRWDEATEELSRRLGEEPATRIVTVLDGRRMLVDDYLVTRLVEMLVHSDDLAMSLDVPLPDFPPAAWQAVLGCLTEVALRRHGPLAVVRAMTRTERDHARALRVL